MKLAELKNLVMTQTNNDADDLPDFMPYLLTYLNDGYDRLVHAFTGGHIDEMMLSDDAEPKLPVWSHSAIADWATWLVYRNGNPQKQSRGAAFRASFSETESRLRGMTPADKGEGSASGNHFINIPL